MSDELLTHEDWIEVWKRIHANIWKKFAGNTKNEKLLLEATEKFRPCQTAVDRAFQEVRASLVRTDGKTADDDRREAAERTAAQERELEQAATVDIAFLEYAQGLSMPDLQRAYFGNVDFARSYRVLVRDHGFRLPAQPKRGI